MQLNQIKPAAGSTHYKRRVGRGIGCGLGKTCGRGHKGQKSRSGGFHKVGFEGGQMPIQRRMPKSGFRSQKALVTQEVRLSDLNKMTTDVIDLISLKAEGLITKNTVFVKIILAGELNKKSITVQGVGVTAGARKAIEAAGGKVEG